ncbi:MAG: type II toxin-antitoxin system prevent-host-death family antitoxin [Ornithinimicrobium sp.]
MQVGVRELRNHTSRVIEALRVGESVTLTVRGEPIADIVPHGARTRWLAGESMHAELISRAADTGLRRDLEDLAGSTLADL